MGTHYSTWLHGVFTGPGTVDAQLTDLNRGVDIISAEDRALIASGTLIYDTANNVATAVSDVFPDTFGPASLDDARIVVNDQIYFTAEANSTAAFTPAWDVAVTVRIKCKVVSLATKDWMALAIQSTAADN